MLRKMLDAGLQGGFGVSSSHDPAQHLAMEETLLDRADPKWAFLWLWVNDPCVVLGKHQNPWLECDLQRMASWDIPLYRRLSGGGTVYHDRGNLNYSVVAPRAGYCEREIFDFIIRSLAADNIQAVRKGRSGLFVEGKKISGTAFAYRKSHVIHHGTLLVASDLYRLQEVLDSPIPDIQTHAVRSDPAPVTNISVVNPGVTMERVQSRLLDGWKSVWPDACAQAWPDLERALIERYRSRDWIYGKTPRFQLLDGREVVGGLLDGQPFSPA